MAMSDHDLNEQDKGAMEKFLDYLPEETSWRFSFKGWSRSDTLNLWDNAQVNGACLGVYIGAVVDLLKLPLEDLVTKCITAHPKGWEIQVIYYRFKNGE